MSALEQVTAAALRAQLSRIGYQELDTSGRAGDTWVDEANEERPAILVPREDAESRLGYADALATAVDKLAWTLGRSVQSVVDALSQVGDEFELRISHSSTSGGRLPVVRAPGVVEGFLKVLRAGARVEFRGARPAYRGADPTDVNTALDGIDLLAPAPGSFRLIAVSSIETQLAFEDAGAIPDFPRRAVAATMRALAAAAETTDNEIPEDPDLLLPAVDRGVSTNLLNGLREISDGATGMAVEFVSRWDATLPRPNSQVDRVSIRDLQLTRVPALISLLQEHEPVENQTITGWIKTISADALHAEGQPSGYVIVEARRDGRPRDVRIELSPEEFSAAKPGASFLTATGTLERISGRWHLTQPHNLRINTTAS